MTYKPGDRVVYPHHGAAVIEKKDRGLFRSLKVAGKEVLGSSGRGLVLYMPGETKQDLHQDDGLWPIPRPHPSFLCNVLIAFDDFTLENGATHVVPFSHTWTRPVDQTVESVQVELKSGSALFWEGGLWL